MDRDGRWERTDRAFRAIYLGEGETADDPLEAVRRSYEGGITDEFILPTVIRGRPRLLPSDTAIFENLMCLHATTERPNLRCSERRRAVAVAIEAARGRRR